MQACPTDEFLTSQARRVSEVESRNRNKSNSGEPLYDDSPVCQAESCLLLERVVSTAGRPSGIEADHAARVRVEIPVAGLSRSGRIAVQLETDIGGRTVGRLRRIVEEISTLRSGLGRTC